MLRRATVILVLLLPAGLFTGGCGDECQQLSDVVCECGETRADREACRREIESQQQNQTPASEAQLGTCRAALETCTCAALEQNRTDLCGFTRDEGVIGDEEGA